MDSRLRIIPSTLQFFSDEENSNPVVLSVTNLGAAFLIITGIQAGYSAAPTGGKVSVVQNAGEADEVIKFAMVIGEVPFASGAITIVIAPGKTLTVTLTDGGAVIGSLNVQYALAGE